MMRLVFDAHKDEVEKIKPVIIECMQTALALPNDVPTDAEIGSGDKLAGSALIKSGMQDAGYQLLDIRTGFEYC